MSGISIIIPTTCSRQRVYCLLRAIDSALDQKNISVEIIVVVNGNLFDQDLFEQLKADSRLSTYYLAEGNVSKARYYGITQSNQNYFSFLDDDDELLPNTLKQRFDVLNTDNEACVAVSNGYFFDGKDRQHVDSNFHQKILESIEFSFLEKNWFASPAALYKKKKIDTMLFDMEHQYFEMSYIFFKLVEKQYKIIFINTLAYRCHEDNGASASKSEAYRIAYPGMIKLILGMDLSDAIKKILKRKYVSGLNSLSAYFLIKGDIKKAFYFHMKCLLSGGINYIFYSRIFLTLKNTSKDLI